jgi:hypothetical protein
VQTKGTGGDALRPKIRVDVNLFMHNDTAHREGCPFIRSALHWQV